MGRQPVAPESRNYWSENAQALASAFLRSDGSLVTELVVRALRLHLPDTPARVLDVGGGDARVALALAREGHEVTVLDMDGTMLDAARHRCEREDAPVRGRLRLLQGRGEDAPRLAGTAFDLVCCHSVLMYVEEPAPLLQALVAATRRGGLVSVLSVNADAIAMRDGLQGRWRDAIASLRSGCEAGQAYLPSAEPSLGEVAAQLDTLGTTTLAWYGVGIFTDHLTQALVVDEPWDVVEAEWLAGQRDPYRGVARCYHLLAGRVR